MASYFKRRNRRQDKRERELLKLSRWRKLKAEKRQRMIDAGLLEREPKLTRAYPLEFGVRRFNGSEECWTPLKSVRDAAKRLRLVLKYCA